MVASGVTADLTNIRTAKTQPVLTCAHMQQVEILQCKLLIAKLLNH